MPSPDVLILHDDELPSRDDVMVYLIGLCPAFVAKLLVFPPYEMLRLIPAPGPLLLPGKLLLQPLEAFRFSDRYIVLLSFRGRYRHLVHVRHDVLKRLIRLIRDNITSIAAYPPFHVTAEIEEKLIGLSPGASLNSLIPVRAYYSYAERNEAGCFEIDTVVHCGYGPQNDSLWTLSLTDVANGFIYIRPLRAKTQRYVLEALDDIAENTS